MGRGFLSIKLAAVCGLLVVAAVTVEQRRIALGVAAEAEVAAERITLQQASWFQHASAESAAVVVDIRTHAEGCPAKDSTNVDTMRAGVRVVRPVRAIRS